MGVVRCRMTLFYHVCAGPGLQFLGNSQRNGWQAVHQFLNLRGKPWVTSGMGEKENGCHR